MPSFSAACRGVSRVEDVNERAISGIVGYPRAGYPGVLNVSLRSSSGRPWPRRTSRDCNHSTEVGTDGRLPVTFPPALGVASAGSVRTVGNHHLGGYVIAANWVYFFLGAGVLSLMVPFLFARPVD